MKIGRLFICICLLCLGMVLAAVEPKDFAGSWEGSSDTPNGSDAITLTLELKGGTWTGRMRDSIGLVPDIEVTNVQINEQTITFSISINYAEAGGSLDVSFSMELKEDTLSGTWSTFDGSTGAISLQKKS